MQQRGVQAVLVRRPARLLRRHRRQHIRLRRHGRVWCHGRVRGLPREVRAHSSADAPASAAQHRFEVRLERVAPRLVIHAEHARGIPHVVLRCPRRRHPLQPAVVLAAALGPPQGVQHRRHRAESRLPIAPLPLPNPPAPSGQLRALRRRWPSWPPAGRAVEELPLRDHVIDGVGHPARRGRGPWEGWRRPRPR